MLIVGVLGCGDSVSGVVFRVLKVLWNVWFWWVVLMVVKVLVVNLSILLKIP